jgi:hypothetical protein
MLDTDRLDTARHSNDLVGVEFKTMDSNVWGTGYDGIKKFKIRLNSKKSGKKIDVNLKFRVVNTTKTDFSGITISEPTAPESPVVSSPGSAMGPGVLPGYGT